VNNIYAYQEFLVQGAVFSCIFYVFKFKKKFFELYQMIVSFVALIQ